MAPRTPPAGDEAGEAASEYGAAWAEVSRALELGASWSGYERNCAWLQVEGARFADVSYVAGLDFDDDGRSVVRCDWDGDGDLDLWLRSRTGPLLRYMENQSNGRALALELAGGAPNTGAVGARVRVTTSLGTTLHEVRAGEGYLAQCSPQIVRGLGPGEEVLRVEVRWPDGALETFAAGAGRWRLARGAQEAAPLARRERVELAEGALAPAPLPSRVVLRTPLPIEPGVLAAWRADASPSRPDEVRSHADSVPSSTGRAPSPAAGRALCVVIWSTACGDVAGALAALASEDAALGADRLFLGVPRDEDEGALTAWLAREACGGELPAGLACRAATEGEQGFLAAVFEHLFQLPTGLPVPAVLLIDGEGALQVAHIGVPAPDALAGDAREYLASRVRGAERGAYGGRWFHGSPRDTRSLAAALRGHGLEGPAGYYGKGGR